MKVTIKDNGREFTYNNMNWLRARGDELIINQQDENDEECKEFGDVPDAIIFVKGEN